MCKTVYWHLPGFCFHKPLWLALADLMKEYESCFIDGYRIGSVYGTFPGAIWNGGRTVLGFTSKNDIERTIKEYNSRKLPVRFTWTNPLIEEKHCHDTLCNLIMKLADNGENQVLVNSPVLEDYLRKNYPSYKFISSTTKCLRENDELNAELGRDYFMVVLDYNLNHDEEILKNLEPDAGRVEILVDEICFPGCERRLEHYRDEGLKQLEYDVAPPFPCPNRQKTKDFAQCMKRPAFISNEEIGSYIDRGFVNFKLVGRGLPRELVIESVLYYLVKEDDRDFIKRCIDKRLAEAMQKRSTAQRR